MRTAVEKNCNFGQNLTILTEYAPFFDKKHASAYKDKFTKTGGAENVRAGKNYMCKGSFLTSAVLLYTFTQITLFGSEIDSKSNEFLSFYGQIL